VITDVARLALVVGDARGMGRMRCAYIVYMAWLNVYVRDAPADKAVRVD
jgi:hypothetical protein